MLLTQKLRIFPEQAQEIVLWDLSEKCRLLYNFALAERIENWKQNKKKPKKGRTYITYTIQQNRLPILKQKYPVYKWVYSKVLQMTLKKLEADFRSFFSLYRKGDKKARPPRFKSKKRFTTLCYNQSGFKFTPTGILFSHKHPSNVPLFFKFRLDLIPEGKIKQVELFLDS